MPYSADFMHTQLKRLRKYLSYKSQAKAARAMNVSPQLWSLWELGRRRPNVTQLVEIANFFHVKVGYFFIPEAEPEKFIEIVESIGSINNVENEN